MNLMFYIRLFFLIVVLLFGSRIVLQAQINVVNKGTIIYIGKNNTVSINGDYIDNNSTGDDFGLAPADPNNPSKPRVTLDAPMFLSGELRISGNIINNSGSETKLIYEYENPIHTGKVTLFGSNNRVIGGTVTSYFPNLELNMTSASIVTFQDSVIIDNNLNLTTGHINLNGQVMALGQHGSISNESAASTISGFPGWVETAVYPINPHTATDNYKGIGLGYASGLHNFAETRFFRIHGGPGPSVTNQYSVGDGIHVFRIFKMQTSTVDVDDNLFFTEATFWYNDSELNGLNETTLALYVSNDDGVSWVKAKTTERNTGLNYITVENVHVAGGSTVNIFTLAIEDCQVKQPDATITSATAPIAANAMDICEESLFEISVPFNATNDYIISRVPQNDSLFVNIQTIANISFDDEGTYNVFVRNTYGCESTSALEVDVKDKPLATFDVLDPGTDNFAMCLRDELTFRDTTDPLDESIVTSRSWTFDDTDLTARTVVAQNTPFTYSEDTGEVTPTLVVTTNFGCISEVASKIIAIETLPDPGFIIRDGVGNEITEICEDQDVYFEDQSSYTPWDGTASTLSNQWNFGDGNTSSDKEPVHAFLTHNDYIVTLRVTTDVTGCYNDISKPITINPEPIPQFVPRIEGSSITEACAGVYILFDNTSTMPGITDMTFAWDFGDGTFSTEVSPLKQFVVAGDYDVTLTATSNVYGCYESYVMNITINPPPTGTFTIADEDICLVEEAIFTNNSAILSGTMSYLWEFADGNTSTSDLTTVAHSYSEPMQYRVTLTRVSDKGCTNSVSRNLTVHPSPVADFIFRNTCDGDAVTFYNISAVQFQSDSIQHYAWDFDDNGNTSSVVAPAYLFSSYGDYNVSLTATSNFGCTHQVSHEVNIYRNPSFNLGAAVVGCDEEYLLEPAADVNAFLPSGSTYQWKNANDETVSATQQAQVNESGVYSVVIKSPAPESCESTVHVPLFLFKPVSLGDDITACAQAILDAESGLAGEKIRAEQTTYEWKRDGNVISTQQVLTATQSGEYTITITRTIAGVSCSSSDVIQVNIELPLTGTLPPHLTSCEGETLLLDAGVDVDSYLWTHLNSGAIVGDLRTLEVTASGVYKLEVTNASCTASTISTVTISPLPATSFDVSASSFCVGESAALTDYSFADVGDITSRAWDFGDGTDAFDQTSIAKSYAAPGDYTITLTATTDHGCSDTYSVDVVIKSLPLPDFTIANACVGETLDIQNHTSLIGTTFLWNFDDGTLSDETQPGKSFGDEGQYDITLTATGQGCSASITKPVTINPLPDLNFGDQVTTCGSSVVLDALNPGSAYRWFDASLSTVSTNQQYTMSGDGQIGLEITNSFGCKSTDIANVVLNTPIVVSLGTDRQVCDEETLDAGYFPGALFTWSNGADTREITVNTSGMYNVSVTDQNGCTGGAAVVLEVNSTPVVTLERLQTLCDGSELVLDAGFNPAYSYLWSNAATSSAITVDTPGTYNITVTNVNCSADADVDVTLLLSPSANFTSNNICSAQIATFSNLSSWSGDSNVKYLWNFGDGTFSALNEPAKTYNADGTYSVSLKAISEQGCVSEIVKPITIKATPLAEFSVADACTGNNILVNNTSSYSGVNALTYQWNFDNGDSFNGFQPDYAYQAPGNYWISLLVTSDDGCSDNYLQEIVVGTTPSLSNWLTEVSTCNASLTLDAGNAGNAYLWSDNSTSQTLQAFTSGTYDVLITSPEGCSVTASADVTFNDQIQPQLGDAMEGCGSVVIDADVTATSYLWSTGSQASTIEVLATNEYWVQVISSQLCIGRDTTFVDVHPVPVFELGEDLSFCDGQVFELSATVEMPVTRAWSTGAATQSISVSTSGTYSAVLTTDHGCTHEDALNIIFHKLPVLEFDTQVTACGNLELDAENPGSTYLWSTGSAQQVLNVIESGIYRIEVVNEHKCINRDTVEVTILPLPSLELGENLTICNGEVTTLDAGTSANHYLWSDNSKNRYLTVGSTGNYSVTISNDLGCSSGDEVIVTIREPLPLELGEDQLLCNNEGIYLNAGVSDVVYEWGSSVGFSSQEKEIRPAVAGTYWIEIIDNFQCVARDTITISETTETIIANFLIPSVIDRGDAVQFAQLTEPEPVSFHWTFGDGGSSQEKNPTHRYFRAGEFAPMLVVSNGVCSDTLTKTIIVRNGRFEVVEQPKNLPELLDIVSANLFPNPFKGRVALDLALTTEAEVWISIFSINGNIIDEKRKVTMEDRFEFDLTRESDGVYLMKVVVKNRVKVFKLVKTGGY